MSAIQPSLEVWEHGVLPLPASSVNEAALLALLDVPRGLSADLTISMEQWLALATEGLGLTNAAASACMRLCHVLSPGSADPQPMPRDHALRVPLGSLLLLLWVQASQRELQHGSAALGGKAQAASGDIWPSLSLPPAAMASAGVGAGAPCARTLAVQARLGQHPATQLPTASQRRRMLQASLPTLLRLVGAGAERLYSNELDRLGLLLCPDSIGAARLAARGLSPHSLSAALGLWDAQPAAALPITTLLPSLRAALVEVIAPPPRNGNAPVAAASNPLASPPGTPATSPPSPAATGGGVGWKLAVVTSGEERDPPSSGTLQHEFPSGTAGAPTLRLVGSRRRTVVLREAQLRGGSLQLIDCHACFVYVLAPVRSAELLGCCGCTVVLGAVERVVSVQHCERLKLHGACRALRLHNCIDAALALCVATPPLLWGENHRLTLAPFHTTYAGLASHLAAARLSPRLESNYWERPVLMGAHLGAPPSSSSPRKGDAPPPLGATNQGDEGVSLLPPHKLLPFHVPVDVPAAAAQGHGTVPVCELPTEYAAALQRAAQRLDDFRAEVESLECSDELKLELQRTLQAHFKEWLQRSGNLRQVHDLMALGARAGGGGSGGSN